MDGILQDKTNELVEELINSDVYRRYQELLNMLKQNEAMYNRVNEYRIDNKELMTMSADEWISYGDNMILRYQDVFRDDTAREFLAVEDDLCRLLWELKEHIYRSIDMDLDFLD